MLSNNVLYYGQDEPLPERIALRAGPLSLCYEAGDLRYIQYGQHEILRRVYVAVRDQSWNTILPRLHNVQVTTADDNFHIRYEVENQQDAIDFAWRGEITGAADGTITFTMAGEARSTFLRNRIGFCVLHPMSCAGAPVRIEHVDGTVEADHFPRLIAPQLVVDGVIQPMHPFSELRALAHEVMPGVWAEVRYSGDIFETEDQRNWTDASYKTYSTPLRRPFPVEIKAGAKIAQAVTLTVQGDALAIKPATAALAEQPVRFSVAGATAPKALPQIGLGIASHGQPLGEQEIARLRALHLAHLRVDLQLAQNDWAAKLARAATEAKALGIGLEVALHLTDNGEAELTALRQTLAAIQPPVLRWLVFHTQAIVTPAQWVETARPILAGYAPQAPVGGGTNIYFTDLNRARPDSAALDVVAYSFNPQVHAFDNSSLVETLAAQAVTATSARRFCGERLLAVGPVTLLPRFNPHAAGPERPTAPGELPPQVDVRQMSLLGAGWTLGSIKYLAESGEVASITYYETAGWRGVMETAQGSPAPARFRSTPSGVFPLYHVLAAVGEYAGGAVLPVTASAPLRVDGLVLQRDGHKRALVANLTAEAQRVRLEGLGERVAVWTLAATSAEAAIQSPATFRQDATLAMTTVGGKLELALLPYAIACIDFAD